MSWTRGFSDAVKAMVEKNIPKSLTATEVEPNSIYKLFVDAAKNRPSSPFYAVSAEDWYKTYPYRFTIGTETEEGNIQTMTPSETLTYYSLPIPPEALSYQMISASQLIPTLGGVVEETSATVFWQINLSGTTGIAVSRQYTGTVDSTDKLDAPASQEENFRRVLKGGILANSFNKVANLADAVTGVASGGSSALGLLEGLASTSQRFNSSAVKTSLPPSDTLAKVSNFFNVDLGRFRKGDGSTNGYVEIHLLHNFLNAYSHLKEKEPNKYNLYFESQKDNMKWRVVVKGFSFQKNANQPYLYKYNISLQGFDLTEVGALRQKNPVDRFGPDGDLNSVNSFTLTSVLERGNSLIRKINTNPLGLITSKPSII